MSDRDLRNIDVVRRFYGAEETVAAPDIVWHVPGHNPVSGEYRGRDAYFTTMVSRMGPLDAWQIDLGDIMVNGDVVTTTFTLHGERRGIAVDLRGCHVLRINDEGQVAEGWGFTSDQDALDAFFSA